MAKEITVYGADTCKDTRATREHLDALGIKHGYINVDEDKGAERKVEEWNDGKRKTPTVLLASDERTRRLSVPSNTQLDAELDRLGLLPRSESGDGSPGLEQ